MSEGAPRFDETSAPLLLPSAHEPLAKELPIMAFEQEIIQSVLDNQVTVVFGGTGSGKSTQVPQMLRKLGFNVTVTQPRILAAKSVSERIRYEHLEKHPSANPFSVGYRTAEFGDSTLDTNILVATDGLVLRHILFNDALERWNDVFILDEAHEANKNQSYIMASAKQKIATNPNVRIVIMSATINTESYAQYFANPKTGEPAPVINVPGRMYDVREVHEIGSMEDRIAHYAEQSLNIQAFVPGKPQIADMMSRLSRLIDPKVVVLPLEGDLPLRIQERAMDHYEHGKVILSTDVGQTSLTVPDLDVVIDSSWSRMGHALNDQITLDLVESSGAVSDQRRGRVGRTKPGIYERAQLPNFPPLRPRDMLPAYDLAQIQTNRIDDLVLLAAQSGTNIRYIDFYHAPPKESITASERRLQNMGALTVRNTITETGEAMTGIGVDPQYARMLVEARKYRDSVRIQVAALVAIQQVNGIVKVDSSSSFQWHRLTKEKQSDAIAELDVFVQALGLQLEQLYEYDIIEGHFTKALTALERILEKEGLNIADIRRPSQTERAQIIACMLTAIDEVFVPQKRGDKFFDTRGQRRHVHEESVVRFGAGLVIGKSFNLTVPKGESFGTEYLINGATLIPSVSALKAAAPERFQHRDVGFALNKHGHVLAKTELYFDGLGLGEYSVRPAAPSFAQRTFLVRSLVTGSITGKVPPQSRKIKEVINELYTLQHLTDEFLNVEGIIDDIVLEIARYLPEDIKTIYQADPYIPTMTIDHMVHREIVHEIQESAPQTVTFAGKTLPVDYKDNRAILRIPLSDWVTLPEKIPELGDREILVQHPADPKLISIIKAKEIGVQPPRRDRRMSSDTTPQIYQVHKQQSRSQSNRRGYRTNSQRGRGR